LFVACVSFLCSGAVQAVGPLVVVQQINDKEMNENYYCYYKNCNFPNNNDNKTKNRKYIMGKSFASHEAELIIRYIKGTGEQSS
jgi:nickel-dependent lactate racemase